MTKSKFKIYCQWCLKKRGPFMTKWFRKKNRKIRKMKSLKYKQDSVKVMKLKWKRKTNLNTN